MNWILIEDISILQWKLYFSKSMFSDGSLCLDIHIYIATENEQKPSWQPSSNSSPSVIIIGCCVTEITSIFFAVLVESRYPLTMISKSICYWLLNNTDKIYTTNLPAFQSCDATTSTVLPSTDSRLRLAALRNWTALSKLCETNRKLLSARGIRLCDFIRKGSG